LLEPQLAQFFADVVTTAAVKILHQLDGCPALGNRNHEGRRQLVVRFDRFQSLLQLSGRSLQYFCAFCISLDTASTGAQEDRQEFFEIDFTILISIQPGYQTTDLHLGFHRTGFRQRQAYQTMRGPPALDHL
jgi:hypothetical protein